jgi:leader peptidase (prepilin peptidase) / N-methyltransferase
MNDLINFFMANPDSFLIFTAVFSLFIGSFLNVVIYRLPYMMEQSWNEECRTYLRLKSHTPHEQFNLFLPFSRCPHCKKSIRPWHNVPLLSYLFLSGKCADCRAPISLRYPLVEALTCLMSIYVAWKFGCSWSALSALLFTWICICLTFIDLDCHLLPDHLTLLLLWAGLFSSLYSLFANSHDAILGAIIGYLIFAAIQWLFQHITGKTGMGQGDFKFLAALGAYLGWQLLPLVILLASVSGVFFTFIHMLIKRHFKSTPLPFGPYLALAGWLVLVWGKEMNAYFINIV